MEEIVKLRGRVYKIDLYHASIAAIMYNGSMNLFFGEFQLRIDKYFMWYQFNKKLLIDISEKEAFEKFYHLYGKLINDLTISKTGDITLKLQDGITIEVNGECSILCDPHCEFWHLFYDDKLVAYNRLGETVIL